LLASGCLSYNTLEGSRERVALRRAIQANNEAAIRAIKSGESPKAAGIKVSTWEAISERPLLQTGAAVGDGLLIWGGVEGVKWIANEVDDSDDDEDDKGGNTAGGDVIIIDGDGNYVDTSTTTTSN